MSSDLTSNLVTALALLRNPEGESWVTLREAEGEALVAEIERLQQRVAEVERNYKWLDDEMVKPLSAENERLRSVKNLPANLLGTMEQALREVSHAQQVGSSWYSRGEDGLYQQVAMWVRKGFEAIKIARDAQPPTASKCALCKSPDETRKSLLERLYDRYGAYSNDPLWVEVSNFMTGRPALTKEEHRVPLSTPAGEAAAAAGAESTADPSIDDEQHTDSLIEKLESVIAGETAEPLVPKYECCFCRKKFLTSEVRSHHEETCKQI